MKTIYFTDADDPIDIRYDPVFKAVFTKETPAAKTALSDLVSALIGRNVSIITIAAKYQYWQSYDFSLIMIFITYSSIMTRYVTCLLTAGAG